MLNATQTGHGTILFTAKKSPPVQAEVIATEVPLFRPPTGQPPPPVQTFVTGAIPSDGSIPIAADQEPPPPIA